MKDEKKLEQTKKTVGKKRKNIYIGAKSLKETTTGSKSGPWGSLAERR